MSYRATNVGSGATVEFNDDDLCGEAAQKLLPGAGSSTTIHIEHVSLDVTRLQDLLSELVSRHEEVGSALLYSALDGSIEVPEVDVDPDDDDSVRANLVDLQNVSYNWRDAAETIQGIVEEAENIKDTIDAAYEKACEVEEEAANLDV